MQTRIVEAISQMNWGKFMLGRFQSEWRVRSSVTVQADAKDTVPLLARVGWTPNHLMVFDLQTGEGGIFKLGGCAKADLNKHKLWVCPLFEPFLVWLYKQDVGNLEDIPALVELEAPGSLQGYRRGKGKEQAA